MVSMINVLGVQLIFPFGFLGTSVTPTFKIQFHSNMKFLLKDPGNSPYWLLATRWWSSSLGTLWNQNIVDGRPNTFPESPPYSLQLGKAEGKEIVRWSVGRDEGEQRWRKIGGRLSHGGGERPWSQGSKWEEKGKWGWVGIEKWKTGWEWSAYGMFTNKGVQNMAPGEQFIWGHLKRLSSHKGVSKHFG